jgi:hypothetical protein
MKTLDEEYDSKIEKINSRYGGKRRMAKRKSGKSGKAGKSGKSGKSRKAGKSRKSMKNRCNSRKTKRN